MAIFAIGSLTSLNSTMQEVLRGPELRAQWEEQLHWRLLAIVRAEMNVALSETPQQIETYGGELQQQREGFNNLADRISAIASAEGRKRFDILRAGFQRYTV